MYSVLVSNRYEKNRERMSVASFQYLKHPFSRSFGESGEWFEEDSYPSPLKPYFKGSNCIPEDHPSKSVRKLIHDEVAPASEIPAAFPGNTFTSKLHKHEELFRRFMESMKRNEVPLQDEWIQTVENDAIMTVQPFSDTLDVIHFENHDFVVPEKSGFFIGDILNFLKHPVPCQFDIVGIYPLFET